MGILRFILGLPMSYHKSLDTSCDESPLTASPNGLTKNGHGQRWQLVGTTMGQLTSRSLQFPS